MLQKFKVPHQDSPLSLFAWRRVLSIYMAFIVLCLVLIAFHVASHMYGEIYLLILSMLSGFVVLQYLWSGDASNFAGHIPYKKNPAMYWFGIFTVFLTGVIMLFVLGSGWFMQIHYASN